MKSNKRYKFAGLVLGLALWELAAQLIGESLILPDLKEVFQAFLNILKSKQFLSTVNTTILRIFFTIVIDTLLAFLLALPAGLNPKFEAILHPFETMMRAVPTMGILLLSLIWFDSEITPIFVSSLIALPILYRGITNGIKNIDPKLSEMSKLFKVPFYRKLKQLFLPSIKPFILTAYSASLGLLVKVMITAEVLSQPKKGVGTQLQIARSQLDTATIFAWSLLAIFFAGFLDFLMQKFLKVKKQDISEKLKIPKEEINLNYEN